MTRSILSTASFLFGLTAMYAGTTKADGSTQIDQDQQAQDSQLPSYRTLFPTAVANVIETSAGTLSASPYPDIDEDFSPTIVLSGNDDGFVTYFRTITIPYPGSTDTIVNIKVGESPKIGMEQVTTTTGIPLDDLQADSTNSDNPRFTTDPFPTNPEPTGWKQGSQNQVTSTTDDNPRFTTDPLPTAAATVTGWRNRRMHKRQFAHSSTEDDPRFSTAALSLMAVPEPTGWETLSAISSSNPAAPTQPEQESSNPAAIPDPNIDAAEINTDSEQNSTTIAIPLAAAAVDALTDTPINEALSSTIEEPLRFSTVAIPIPTKTGWISPATAVATPTPTPTGTQDLYPTTMKQNSWRITIKLPY